MSMLQDCFETIDWQIFREAAKSGSSADMEEYSSSVLDYMRKCIEDVTTSKTITRNQKTSEILTECRGTLAAENR